MTNTDHTSKASRDLLFRQDDLRQEIEHALRRAGDAAAAAEQARKVALAEVGALMRLARDAGDLVGPTRAEHLTGLSRQTVADQRDNSQPWDEITETAELAHGYEDKMERLHEMYPHLNQIPTLASWLREQLRDPSKPFDPFALEEEPRPVQLLRDLHYKQVERLAVGTPTAASDQLPDLYKEVTASRDQAAQ